MSKADEKCLKLIDFGLSKIFLAQGDNVQPVPLMQSDSSSPIRKTSRRVPKNAMKTRAGTVDNELSSLSILPLKCSRAATMRSAMCGQLVLFFTSYSVAIHHFMERQTKRSSSKSKKENLISLDLSGRISRPTSLISLERWCVSLSADIPLKKFWPTSG